MEVADLFLLYEVRDDLRIISCVESKDSYTIYLYSFHSQCDKFQVCFSEDGLTLLAALGSGDVAVLDLRMVSKEEKTKKAFRIICLFLIFKNKNDN
jgi:hypothetical protein